MKKYWVDTERDWKLFVPVDEIAEALDYARKNNIHRIDLVEPETPCALDLSPIGYDDNIYFLDMRENLKLNNVSFEPLYSAKNLKSLCVHYIKCNIDFSKLPNLEELYINGTDKEVRKLYLPKLHHILLRKVKNKDCTLLSSLQNLKLLRIYQGCIETLTGTEHLYNIEKMELAYCRYLRDISAIAALPGLTGLHVEKCKGITDFSFLKGNTSIKKLFFSEAGSLDFIPKMKNIEEIFFWNVKDGNLKYLLENTSLKKIYFFPDKKHYTHKLDDILKLFEEQRKS